MITNSNLSEIDAVLIKRAVEGDETAFNKIYTQLSGKMYSLCLRYASNTEDANDIFQDGFIKLYRNLGAFRNDGSFEGWARRIFVTTSLDALKKKRTQFTDIEENLNAVTTENTVLDKLSLDHLMNIIKDLPAGYRTIINLHIIENYSHKEISEILGITESGSKSKLHKARAYIKKLLPEVEIEQ
ncbi:MAG: RNA polymerase sigma factor [Ferruginibacter sp.]|nr:RNA polymerase sigma factor [Ferruginibacter sp.]